MKILSPEQEAKERAFETFWRAYPRRIGKLNARRAWDRIAPDAKLQQQMLEALDWQREQWDDPRFTPHPATWLNGGRWMDEPPDQMSKPDISPAGAMVLRVLGGGKAR